MTKEEFVKAYEEAVPTVLRSRKLFRKAVSATPKAAKLKNYGSSNEAEKKAVSSDFEKAFKNWHSKTSDNLILKANLSEWRNLFGRLGFKFGIEPVEKIAPQLEECQKGLATKVEMQSFDVESLIQLSNDSMKELLPMIDSLVLAKAFKRMDFSLRNKILSNMSKRAAAMLEEDVEFMGPITRDAAIEATEKISEAVFKLYQEGKVKFVKK